MDYVGNAITDKGDISRSWSKYFYGCCKASNDFAKAEEITQENRYLCIATSGGLNQQRTGVATMVEEKRRKMNWANYVEDERPRYVKK
ncbi:O-fucosyltransferase 6-like isoform X2 [Apium graveolens]|uniref:O-fucosyltransferase 6-like isoform X1 n=1 Tax=Apium graveolens TaxID=4045 RepID=UPI003D7990F9